MAKYKRAETVEDETTYSQEVKQETQQQTAQTNDADSWEKRYGDLRRHTSTQLAEKERKLAEMQKQLDQAAKGQIKFPKTDEEIEAWSKKYPDVAKIVDTIARKRANEALEEGEKRMQSLKEFETKLTRREAEQELLRMHPDFAEIRQRKDFHDWAALQPQYIQDALYKNNTDAKAAARAIDLYKADMSKAKGRNPRSAAESVGRSSTAAPSGNGQPRFTESQVERMSIEEYAKNEAAILEAMRTKNFVYDKSGGAR